MLVPYVKKKRAKPAFPPKAFPPADASPSLPRAAWEWRPHAWRLLALWLLALAAYSNSFRSGLVLDNSVIVGEDPRLRAITTENLNLILTQEVWYSHATTGLYRPLTTFSYLLNYAVFGNGIHPAGYHWMNFALHAANMFLVYGLGLLILERVTLAWALAALWGLHPLLTEAVT